MAKSGKNKKIKKTSGSVSKKSKKSSPKVKKKPSQSSPVKTASGKKGPKVKKSAKKITGKPLSKKIVKRSKKKTIAKSTQKKRIQKKKLPQKIKEKGIDRSNEYDLDEDSRKRGDTPMTIVNHLDEFRSRILIVLTTIIIFTIAGFFLSDYLLAFINKPFSETGNELHIFKLTGGFMIRLKASFVVGILLGFPVLTLQIWRFIQPAIAKNDKTFSRLSVVASVFLFYGGMAFVFFLLLPLSINILLSFIDKDLLSTTIGANDYVGFILKFSLAMGILFELPIVVMVLTRLGMITPHFLISKRKYAVVVIWIIAAFITPADVLSQIVVAIPLMFLYEISIFISKFIMRQKGRKI